MALAKLMDTGHGCEDHNFREMGWVRKLGYSPKYGPLSLLSSLGPLKWDPHFGNYPFDNKPCPPWPEAARWSPWVRRKIQWQGCFETFKSACEPKTWQDDSFDHFHGCIHFDEFWE